MYCTGHQLKIIPFQTSAWFRKSLFRSNGHFWPKKHRTVKNCILLCFWGLPIISRAIRPPCRVEEAFFLSSSEPPSIFKYPRSDVVSAAEGDAVVLECHGRGGSADITWDRVVLCVVRRSFQLWLILNVGLFFYTFFKKKSWAENFAILTDERHGGWSFPFNIFRQSAG